MEYVPGHSLGNADGLSRMEDPRDDKVGVSIVVSSVGCVDDGDHLNQGDVELPMLY